ncbi:MAG TPA: DUF2334 domain-containing protein [Planctomycetota bacterium]|jgi:peptidoglycan/xylan/chitin deacetylase (PgdA/CDA1 family)
MESTFGYLVASSALVFVASTLAADARAGEKAPVIILKLDDVTTQGAHESEPISPRWQRVVDFLEKENLKASLGIIGFSLEQDNAAYFNWIKNLDKKGAVEFWNHGYRNRSNNDKSGEFESDSAEQQKALLEKTQKLAKEKLGIELHAFGPHWSATTEATEKALQDIPELTMWLLGPKSPKTYTKFVFERIVNLENPTFVPDFDKFKAAYEKNGVSRPYLCLQGHPNSWSDERWAGFVKIIGFLKEKGCTFMKAGEYLAQTKK